MTAGYVFRAAALMLKHDMKTSFDYFCYSQHVGEEYNTVFPHSPISDGNAVSSNVPPIRLKTKIRKLTSRRKITWLSMGYFRLYIILVAKDLLVVIFGIYFVSPLKQAN